MLENQGFYTLRSVEKDGEKCDEKHSGNGENGIAEKSTRNRVCLLRAKMTKN